MRTFILSILGTYTPNVYNGTPIEGIGSLDFTYITGCVILCIAMYFTFYLFIHIFMKK